MPLFGLIGYPLSHSFSKKYFSKKFLQEELNDHRYELFPIESVDRIVEIIKAHPDLRGLNVTIPYKQLVLPHLHSVQYIPEGIGACNCIKVENGVLTGYNTDIIGFEKSFVPLLQSFHKRVLVLGNGGAAAAVVYVLKKLKMDYKIVSRKQHDGSTITYDSLNEQTLSDHQVIINTTPLGTFPDTDQCPDIPYEFLSGKHYLFDLIYNPARTLFLQKGEERGAVIKNGYDMLVLQAEESWRIWNE